MTPAGASPSGKAAAKQQGQTAANPAHIAQTPSMCRAVIYTYATPMQLGGKGSARPSVTQVPALIQSVHADGTCRLSVFGPHATFGAGGYEVIDNVPFVETGHPGSWMWPPRV